MSQMKSYGNLSFCLIIFIVVWILYSNSFHGNFIWDDRAAVVQNRDVLGETSLYRLFKNDFWGQDITLSDSHKSYRPLTVLSFRLNYYLSGLNVVGFHVFNVTVYGVVCLLVYQVANQWLNITGARLASLIFALHPIHVEAVASVVGRADTLCGLFYCTSIYLYTKAIRPNDQKGMINGNNDHLQTLVKIGLAILCAVAAGLSKEVGITVNYAVLGIFLVLEVLENLRLEIARHNQSVLVVEVARKQSLPSLANSPPSKMKGVTSHEIPLALEVEASSSKNSDIVPQQAIKPSADGTTLSGWRLLGRSLVSTFTRIDPLERITLNIVVLILFCLMRVRLNGGGLYSWTRLENHVGLLPGLMERSLSYAQLHFWYFFKMFYPRHLSFDYGYACIPTVHSLTDWRNVLPLLLYSGLVGVMVRTVHEGRVTIILSLALWIVPLTPALNVFFPVGALLAERLMFVPSIGFCLLCGELLSVDMAGLWMHVSEAWLDEPFSRLYLWVLTFLQKNLPVGVFQVVFGTSSTGRGKKAGLKQAPIALTTPSATPFSLGLQSVYLGLLPVLLLCSVRVVTRNEDWRSEMALFSSALQVCPLSVKALSNYAMLRMNEPDGVRPSLQASLTAVELFPEQVSALINSALAYQFLGDFANAALSLQLALKHAPNNSKAHGYMGNLLFVWSIDQPDQTQANLVREQALVRLVDSAEKGFNAPMNYHRIGSLYIDLEENEEGALFLEAALRRSTAMRTMYGSVGTGQLVLEDDINVPYTYNQLGMAYWKLGRSQEAVESFTKGLTIRPDTVQIHTNLGNLYRELGQIDKAREVMNAGLAVMGTSVPPALLNNLGLLELEQGNYERSLELFRYALERNQDLSTSVEGTIGGGKNVVDVINGNILRAESEMVERSRTKSV